jgi:MFS family permease
VAPRGLLPVLFIGVFMSALDSAVIAPAIPVLRQGFALDNRQVSLVMVSFILFSLASTALMANLGDRHGRRPVFLFSIGLFAAGSLVIALSNSFAMLLLGRVLQGVGSGGVAPTASALIGDAVPAQQRGRALGLIGATHGMAFVLGPPFATAVMLAFSWQGIFLANLPIAALVLVLGARVLPAQPRQGLLPPLDWRGVVLSFGALVALVGGITRIADEWLGLPLWPGLLAAAALLLAALAWVEARAAQPTIPPRLFGQRQLRTAYALTAGAGFGMGSVAFLTSIATQAHGVGAARGGFVLLPLVLCSMAGSVGAGRQLNRLGSRRLLLLGFALLGLGYGGAAFTAWGLWGFVAATVPVGLGVGIVVGGALRSIAIDEAPAGMRGAAQGLINIATSIGTLSAATVVGTLADAGGGGVAGLSLAYGVVAAAMALMFALTLRLRRDGARVAPAAPPAGV